MARMRRDDGIRQAQETLGGDSRYLQSIEVFLTHFVQDAMQCLRDCFPSGRANRYRFHLRRDKKEIPSRGTNLAIESAAIKRLDQAPILRIGLTLNPK